MNKYFGRKQAHSDFGTNRLIRYIKKEKPDLIHIHNVQQNSLNYIKFFEFLKKSKIPVVYTLHDCWSFTGGCYHFFKRNCEKFATSECNNCTVDIDDITLSSKKSYEYKRDLIGNNDNLHIVCVSNWLRDSALKSYMHSMKNLPQTIYNGIDTKIFYPHNSNFRDKLGINENDFVILGVASYWNNDKGLHYFEKIAELLPQDYKLILVGHGLEEMQKKHKNLVCIPSTQNKEELAELYSIADVFVNASLEETFGLTTAEALACGTPAIVFNTTACSEVVDSLTGVSINFQDNFEKDVQSLITSINEIKNNKKLSYTKECVKRINECFSTEKMTQVYLSLYRSVLKQR